MATTAQYWIDRLQLTLLPEEGGLYKETYRSPMTYPQTALPKQYGGSRVAITDIYYLLHGTTFSAFHRLASDEIWHYHAGTTMLAHVIDAQGNYTKYMIGSVLERGETLRVTFPAGCWFAAEMQEKTSAHFSLVSCVVAPGFEFQDFELGTRQQLLTQFPQHRSVIERMTRG